MSETKSEDAAFGHGDKQNGGESGLTKREYFAGLAMSMHRSRVRGNGMEQLMAKQCVAEADALIAALNEADQ